MAAMVNVAIVDEADPYAGFAAAAWRKNPRISPSSWRVAQGLTLSKVVYDGRQDMASWPAALAAGCNALLVRGTPVLEVPEGVAVMAEIGAGEEVPPCEVVWMTVAEEGDMVRLEEAVRDGVCGCYGLMVAADADMQELADRAEAAVQQVWGRRKRSGWRAVRVAVNPLQTAAWQVAASRTGNERVSMLEWTARRGMLVMADGADRWPTALGVVEMGEVGGEVVAASSALVALAEAEREVRERSVWPQVEGKEVFGVLPALRQGQAPWPTRDAWRAWRANVWPLLEEIWRDEPEYVTAWQEVLAVGEMLAAAAESRLAAALAGAVQARLPEVWRDVTPAALVWGVASSLPGVTAVLGDFSAQSACTSFLQVMERPDIVDIEKVCAGS